MTWLTVVGTAFLLAACGGGSSTSGQSPQAATPGTPSTLDTSTPTPPSVAKVSADADACAIVTLDDIKSILGQIAPGPAELAQAASGDAPGLLKGSSCSYAGATNGASTGLMIVFIARFTDSAAAHDALQNLFNGPDQKLAAPLQPVSGLGDEAVGMASDMAAPLSGKSVIVGVRKGTAVFGILASVFTGSGTTDLQGTAHALARKITARL